jgi:hypothetical protein
VKRTEKTTRSQLARDQVMAALHDQVCHCGRRKAAGVSFCPKCVQSLPMELYRPLIANGGEGYGAAYLAALEFLDGLKLRADKRRAACG